MKTVKQHGRVYTPAFLVRQILDFGGYCSQSVLQKHVIDNSCGDGAFLCEITRRYCEAFLTLSNDKIQLKQDLQTFIHAIELDSEECEKCKGNLDEIARDFGIENVRWDVINADTLTIKYYDNRMDYVFGNPPYVRVHNLEQSYETVKQFRFAEGGMTDLYVVFYEIGFNMLSEQGTMCLITPSSWLGSKAGRTLRDYIKQKRNLTGLVDLEHFQAFNATTYTMISRFEAKKCSNKIEYCTFDETTLQTKRMGMLTLEDISIGDNFYLSVSESLSELRQIKTSISAKHVVVKNGFATLADKVFIDDFHFSGGTIEILKASTGKWSKCIFPYEESGIPISIDNFAKSQEAYIHLKNNYERLAFGRDITDKNQWYLFGRTQGLKDVAKNKYAINTIIKDLSSIRLERVPSGKGVYSGLYILTDVDFETIQHLVLSEDFIEYLKMLKNYKSGGYYTFASRDLEQYLNFKLTRLYEQQEIFAGLGNLFSNLPANGLTQQ